MTAHVLSGSLLPLGVEWAAAVLLFGGGVAAVAVRRPAWRRTAIAAAAVGLIVTATGWVADATLPGRAPYALRIVEPQRVTNPAAVFTVCGVRGDGTLLTPTDADHWLVPFIDGAQRSAINAAVYPVRLTVGVHTVRFDLVTPAQREFTPPASVTTSIAATEAAAVAGPGAC